MKLQKIFLLSFVIGSVYLNSCSLHVSREGYTETAVSDTCEVHIYENLSNTTFLKKVGSIGLSDYGLAINCNWDDVITLLKKEACYAKANVVNITKIYSPSEWSSDCYRFDADFYIDSNNSIINRVKSYTEYYTQYLSEDKSYPSSIYSNPSSYFYIDADYTDINKNYWDEMLIKYNFPVVRQGNYMPNLGANAFIGDVYLNLKVGLGSGQTNENDSLKSRLSGGKIDVEIGYNLINTYMILSPYLGFRLYSQSLNLSHKLDKVTIDNWMKYPEIHFGLQQVSGVVGFNMVCQIYDKFILLGNCGYNINLHKYPKLSFGDNSLTINQKMIKDFYFSIGIGYSFESNKRLY